MSVSIFDPKFTMSLISEREKALFIAMGKKDNATLEKLAPTKQDGKPDLDAIYDEIAEASIKVQLGLTKSIIAAHKGIMEAEQAEKAKLEKKTTLEKTTLETATLEKANACSGSEDETSEQDNDFADLVLVSTENTTNVENTTKDEEFTDLIPVTDEQDQKAIKEFMAKEGSELVKLSEEQLRQYTVNTVWLGCFSVDNEDADSDLKPNPEYLKALLRKGANVNFPDKVNIGCTALHFTIEHGDKDSFDFVLAQKPDLSLVGLTHTPLMLAVSKGNEYMVSALLLAGANVDQVVHHRTAFKCNEFQNGAVSAKNGRAIGKILMEWKQKLQTKSASGSDASPNSPASPAKEASPGSPAALPSPVTITPLYKAKAQEGSGVSSTQDKTRSGKDDKKSHGAPNGSSKRS